ncbi:MAG TPA: hemerythrin domain-containing protein [Pseudolabrys sp.]|nr:hemerythrin domain-containing protein [Pseudolabrys sp.]
MSFTNRISQTLHDEHGATVALMERLEQLLAKGRRSGPPDKSDSNLSRLLSDLSTGLEAEVVRHFAFEEDHLFTYLNEIGDTGICEHLIAEHNVMRPLGARVAAMARGAAANGFAPGEWEEFTRLGQELGDLMLAHVQKEEMALLPVIEESMDSETEARLYQEYVENV